LIALMRSAAVVVANGGSTLLQAIACGRPTLAIPIADDQSTRIDRCVAAGVCVAAPLDGTAIAGRAASLVGDALACAELRRNAAALGLADGLDVALRAIERLHDPAGAAAADRAAVAQERPDA
jgi:UDP:flavonoid glycosyltransferase YjiC (YdhE family)